MQSFAELCRRETQLRKSPPRRKLKTRDSQTLSLHFDVRRGLPSLGEAPNAILQTPVPTEIYFLFEHVFSDSLHFIAFHCVYLYSSHHPLVACLPRHCRVDTLHHGLDLLHRTTLIEPQVARRQLPQHLTHSHPLWWWLSWSLPKAPASSIACVVNIHERLALSTSFHLLLIADFLSYFILFHHISSYFIWCPFDFLSKVSSWAAPQSPMDRSPVGWAGPRRSSKRCAAAASCWAASLPGPRQGDPPRDLSKGGYVRTAIWRYLSEPWTNFANREMTFLELRLERWNPNLAMTRPQLRIHRRELIHDMTWHDESCYMARTSSCAMPLSKSHLCRGRLMTWHATRTGAGRTYDRSRTEPGQGYDEQPGRGYDEKLFPKQNEARTGLWRTARTGLWRTGAGWMYDRSRLDVWDA